MFQVSHTKHIQMVKKNNRNAGSRFAWSRVVKDPFAAKTVGIPDDRTHASGKVVSRAYGTFNLPSLAGTSYVHHGGISVYPDPNLSATIWNEQTAGTASFTDLNSLGSSVAGSISAPNVATFLPSNGRCRCVGIGIRIVYEGTEFNRSSKIYGGLAPILGQAQTAAGASAPYALSPGSTLFGGTTWTNAVVKQVMQQTSSGRTSDSVFEAHWIPSGVPNYQSLNPSRIVTGSGPGLSVTPSYFNAPSGGNGFESGQNALVVMIEGDSTAGASAYGNTYTYDIIWHWEVIPQQPYGVPYELTPSPSDPIALARDLNSFNLSLSRGLTISSDAITTAPRNSPGMTSSWTANMPTARQLVDAARMAAQAYRAVMPAARRGVPVGRVAAAPPRRRIEL